MFTHPFRMSQPQADARRPRSWYEIKNATEEEAEIRIYDSIGYWGVDAETFAKDLEAVTARNIVLRINSPGGDVFDGYAIYNLLTAHPATVTTKIDGLAASIASVVALAGETVEIAEAAFFMVHNPWAFVIGNAADMRAMADTLDKVAKPLLSIYSAKTGKTVEEVTELLDAETWYTGEEAVEAGFADVLITSTATEEDDELEPAASLDPSIFVNPPAALAGDSEPAENVIELMKRRLRLIDID